MNQETKDKWLNDLRSGKYNQGKNVLKSVHLEYCCLGVLAEGCNIPSDQASGVDDFRFQFNSKDSSYTYLPDDMLDDDIQKKLSTMNDEGVDFPTIADWIEKNVPVTP